VVQEGLTTAIQAGPSVERPRGVVERRAAADQRLLKYELPHTHVLSQVSFYVIPYEDKTIVTLVNASLFEGYLEVKEALLLWSDERGNRDTNLKNEIQKPLSCNLSPQPRLSPNVHPTG
jgi:hypothetical protein